MNDDQKLGQDQNVVSGVSAQNQPQPQSVGIPNKEQEHMRSVVEKSDVELKIDKDLEDIGVETKTEDIKLTSEQTQAGLQHSGPSMPVSTVPSNNVQLPQTRAQVKRDIKKTKPTDSKRGLLLEVLKDTQRTGFKEQKV